MTSSGGYESLPGKARENAADYAADRRTNQCTHEKHRQCDEDDVSGPQQEPRRVVESVGHCDPLRGRHGLAAGGRRIAEDRRNNVGGNDEAEGRSDTGDCADDAAADYADTETDQKEDEGNALAE